MVTALRYPEPSIKVPAASTVVSGETLTEKRVANINDGLQDVPGVGALGSAGFSLVPSVRGLARRRVLYLIDGARLESDRRTGPNASFVSPEDIERIEVLRSASSVFYGSDAIGGVIHVLTRKPGFEPGLHGRFLAGYGSVNGEKHLGLGLEGTTGPWAFSLSFQYDDAGLYRIPDGTDVLQSQFTQGSLLAKAVRRTDKREIDIGILAARGRDIGKPSTTAGTKPTWYPEEDQNLVQLHWKEKNVGKDGEILVHAFVNPNLLKTLTDTYDGFLTKRILRQDRQHRIRGPGLLFEEGRARVPARGRRRLFRPGRRPRLQLLHFLRRIRGRHGDHRGVSLSQREPGRPRLLPGRGLCRAPAARYPRGCPL